MTRTLFVVAPALFAALACQRAVQTGNGAGATSPRAGSISGVFWARLPDVPDGMRVMVWLDSDGRRVRGGYTAAPYQADIEGDVTTAGAVSLVLYERGITRTAPPRTRRVTLRWDAPGRALLGVDSAGGRFEWVRAGRQGSELRPGLWLGRWTGLPFGIAVETRLSRDPDGRWRAAYQYQGTGGTRDGSFEGSVDATRTLIIAWTEMTESGGMSRGRGRLEPTRFGLRGTYGIDGATEGTGEWVLEPLEP